MLLTVHKYNVQIFLPVANLFTIFAAGSTLEISIDLVVGINSNWPLRVQARTLSIVDSQNLSYELVLLLLAAS